MKRIILLITALTVGTILASSFKCASVAYNTAKKNHKLKLFDEAEKGYEKELKQNPNNEEAWIRLAEVKIQKQDPDVAGAIETILKADDIIKDKNLKKRAANFKYQQWANTYNEGIKFYNKYLKTKNDKFLDSALFQFNLGIRVKPYYPDTYKIRAGIFETKGDTTKGIKDYNKFCELIEPSYKFAVDNGIIINMPREDALKRLDPPKKTEGKKYNDNDSVLVDEFEIDKKQFFLFSFLNDKNKAFVKGWRYDPPEHWLDQEKSMIGQFSTLTYSTLASIYYNKKDFDKSLEFLKKITMIEPSNEQASAFMINIYQQSGKEDEAFKSLENMIKENPDNKFYIAQLGDLYLTKANDDPKYLDKAIAEYKKALEIDEDYYSIMKFLAIAIKNKAGLIQKEESDKQKAAEKENKRYDQKTERYFPLLEESAEYFSRSLESDEYQDDFSIHGELVNIYEVLDEKEKMEEHLGELETMEYMIDDAQQQQYLLQMLNIYSRMKNTEKLEEIQEKLAEYE